MLACMFVMPRFFFYFGNIMIISMQFEIACLYFICSALNVVVTVEFTVYKYNCIPLMNYEQNVSVYK